DDIGERRIVGGEAVERAGLGQLALALFEPRGGGRLAVEGLGLSVNDLAGALETDLRGVPNCPILARCGCDGSHRCYAPPVATERESLARRHCRCYKPCSGATP